MGNERGKLPDSSLYVNQIAGLMALCYLGKNDKYNVGGVDIVLATEKHISVSRWITDRLENGGIH